VARFAYKALNNFGADVSGELEAADRSVALRELSLQGVNVVDLAEDRGRWGLLSMRGILSARKTQKAEAEATPEKLRVSVKQLATITRQLAVSLEAGLPLMNALDVVGEELDHAPSKQLLRELGERVQQGASLSDALAEYPKIFSVMYVHLVKVGETGGMLDAVLTQLADMLERQTELRERVKTASIYPAILLLVGLVSVVVIVAFIVPRIVESLGVEPRLLPLPTRMLLGISGFIWNHWLILFVLVAGGVISFRQFVLRGSGRLWWDRTKLRTPILGRLIRQLEAARFARSLGILARGGVTITEALIVVRDTIQNLIMRDAVYKLAESIKSGESVAKPLQRSRLFPPLLIQMVRVGENTGRLDEMLLRSAAVHEAEVRVSLDRFVNILPVAMILLLAGVIGFIVGALVLAIVEFQTTGAGALG